MQLHSIFRYPVKGLQGESLQEVRLTEASLLPGDRRYGLALPSYDDYLASGYGWAKKAHFVCGFRQPEATAWTGQMQQAQVLAVHQDGRSLDLTTPHGLADLASKVCPGKDLKLIDSQAKPLRHGFTDMKFPQISFANVETTRWLADRFGLQEDPEFGLNPGRFKNNIWLKGLRPWQELDWLDGQQVVQIGGAKVKMFMTVGRCNNINADPKTGKADRNLLQELTMVARELGHYDLGQPQPFPLMGVFGIVTEAGELTI